MAQHRNQPRDPSRQRWSEPRKKALPDGIVGLGIGLAVGVGLAITVAAMAQKRLQQELPRDSAPSRSARQQQGAAQVVSAAVTVRGNPEEVAAAAKSAATTTDKGGQGLAGAMMGDASATLNALEHEPSDVLSWRTEDGSTLVKLEFRPTRGGSMTAVTGLVAIEGGRLASAVRTVLGRGPEASLNEALTEFRMRCEAGEAARAR